MASDLVPVIMSYLITENPGPTINVYNHDTKQLHMIITYFPKKNIYKVNFMKNDNKFSKDYYLTNPKLAYILPQLSPDRFSVIEINGQPIVLSFTRQYTRENFDNICDLMIDLNKIIQNKIEL